ncbi:YjbQ family protein [bacterium]|nr:YjbQ family protein [bacterium]
MFQTQIEVRTRGKGLLLITREIEQALRGNLPQTGLLHLFLLHTSASLLIQENADPTARQDLEEFLERLAPEGQSWHRHTLEGPDDTTSHLKSALTNSSLNIPISNCALGLGTWQGISLWEHRRSAHLRRLTLTVLS